MPHFLSAKLNLTLHLGDQVDFVNIICRVQNMLLRIMAKSKTFLAHLGQIQSLAQLERQDTVQIRHRGHTYSLLRLQTSSG